MCDKQSMRIRFDLSMSPAKALLLYTNQPAVRKKDEDGKFLRNRHAL